MGQFPSSTRPFLKGSKPFAVVLCRFSDVPAFDGGRQQWTDFVSPSGRDGLFDYWRDISYGNIDLVGTEVFGWYTMKYSWAHDANDPFHDGQPFARRAWIAEARRLAQENGVDLTRFYGVIAVVNAYADDSNSGGDTAVSVGQYYGQRGWQHCNRCDEIVFALNRGACAAGGSHESSGSSDYHLSLDNPLFDGQDGWRWCHSCQALCFAGAGEGPCPGGPNHDLSESGPYRVGFASLGFPGQAQWMYCQVCKTLSYSGNGGTGRCAGGGSHDYSASANYKLVSANNSFNTTFCGHETGHCLGLAHSWSANPDTQYGDWFDIMSAMSVGSFTNKYPPGSNAGPGLNAPTLNKLGWVPNNRIFDIQAGSTAVSVPLTSLNHPENKGSLMARIRSPNHVYTVEFRQASGWDAGIIEDAVLIHELRSCYTVGQRDWRWCRKCQALAWNGQAQCPAGSLHNYARSMNYRIVANNPSFPGQNQWKWCHRCSLLSFSGNPEGAGPCPARGAHDQSNSENYTLAISDASAPGQHGWKWCNKCQGLSYGLNATQGTCTAGGLHDHSGSADYALRGNDASAPGDQQWRWCNKCQGIAADGYSHCVVDGLAHDLSQSGDYGLSLDDPSFPGDAGFRFCWKCNGLGLETLGSKPCKEGGIHDFSGSGMYRLLHTTEGDANGQSQWQWCSKCALVSFVGSGGAVPCPAGGNHDNTGSPDYRLANFTDDRTFLIGSRLQAGDEYSDVQKNVKIHVNGIDSEKGTAIVTISKVA